MLGLKIFLVHIAVIVVFGLLLGIKTDTPENAELEKKWSIARVLRKNGLLGRRD